MKKTYAEYEQGRERKNRITICLDDAELLILNDKVNAINLSSRSDFLRQLIIYGNAYKIDYKELSDMNYRLEKIGNNINQIARRMNSQNHIYRSDVEEVKKSLEEIT